MLSKSSSNPDIWSVDFYATGIKKLISHWQDLLIVIVPILINKDMFEPNYNDLKFTVWNHNYFCTNLIVSANYTTDDS